jgi:hypothetical protein
MSKLFGSYGDEKCMTHMSYLKANDETVYSQIRRDARHVASSPQCQPCITNSNSNHPQHGERGRRRNKGPRQRKEGKNVLLLKGTKLIRQTLLLTALAN